MVGVLALGLLADTTFRWWLQDKTLAMDMIRTIEFHLYPTLDPAPQGGASEGLERNKKTK